MSDGYFSLSGYEDGGTPDYEKLRKSIDSDLEDETQEKSADVDLERAQYLSNISAFKADATTEAADKSLDGFRVRFYGQELNADNDVVYVTYVVSQPTKGEYEGVASYLKELAIQKDLDRWFQTDPHSNVHMEEEKEVGERVEIYFPKKNHNIDAFKKDEVDPIAREEPEEDEGGF
jgi:hypothetical protein